MDEVHSVGGLHPDQYRALRGTVGRVTNEHPHVSIKALTAVEIKHLSQRSSIPTKEVLLRLKNAGLTSLPGGGAEILNDDVRFVICNGRKVLPNTSRFTGRLTKLGCHQNCTMLFGTIESLEQRLQHMVLLRELNEQTRGFQCFVPYPFLPDSTRLQRPSWPVAQVLRTWLGRCSTTFHIKAYRMNIETISRNWPCSTEPMTSMHRTKNPSCTWPVQQHR